MIYARVTHEDGKVTDTHEVRLTAAGVIFTLNEATIDEMDILIPYASGRVLEVYSPTLGQIEIELGN